VFERYTEPARGVVVHAQEEARGLGHDFLAPEHLLLGVLREDPAPIGVGEETVRALVVQRLGAGVGGEEWIPFTDGATAVLERALELAVADRHVVTPAHLLRALLEQDGPAEILRACGRPPEQVRAALAGLPPEPDSDG
jgi:ATP-dependent Clp protease ATP-binding subunit ClpC